MKTIVHVNVKMNRSLILVALIILGNATVALGQPDKLGQPDNAFRPDQSELPNRGMWSERPADRWQDALVTGNGTLGAMVLGDPNHERIVVNHERLYEPLLDEPCPVPDISTALPEVRRMLLDGQYKEAYQYSYQAALEVGFPGIQWTDPYHPACAVEIEQAISGDVSNYFRSTDFESGEVEVCFRNGEQRLSRQTFASRPDQVIVHRINSSSGGNVSGTLQLTNQDRRAIDQRVDKKGGGYHSPVVTVDGQWISYRCKYDRSDRGYEVIAHVAAIDGKVESTSDSIKFDANEVIMLIAINSLEDFADVEHQAKVTRARMKSLSFDYDTLLKRHADVHGELMGRVKIDLGGGDDRNLSSEALIALQKESQSTHLNHALLEKMFDMGRYSLISSSGQLPPNLMGIWNGDWRPDWSGDFTLDANVNLQIAGANLGNLPEAMTGYSHLVNSLVSDWKINAKNLFGCRGVVSGIRTDGRHNLNTHFSTKFPGHLWTAGAQWMALPMWEHYQTTGDQAFLDDELLPLMKQIVVFYEDFLTETDALGKRIFAPSYSPENHPSNTGCPAAINATMDLACAKQAIVNLIEVLGADDHQSNVNTLTAERCRSLMSSLPPYLINDDGALKEWASPSLDDHYDHRHVSHLYPVWPGHEINPEDTPQLFAAAEVAARKRGRGNGSAHGLAHMALIGTRLKDAGLVGGNLRFMLSNDYLLRSLFTFHNPGRIYNADMLHSLPAVVMEMLIYSKSGGANTLSEIELLPALPSELRRGKIQGVCCRNQVVVKEFDWDIESGEANVILHSKVDQVIRLRVRRGIRAAKVLASSSEKSLSISDLAKTVDVMLKADVPLLIELQLEHFRE